MKGEGIMVVLRDNAEKESMTNYSIVFKTQMRMNKAVKNVSCSTICVGYEPTEQTPCGNICVQYCVGK